MLVFFGIVAISLWYFTVQIRQNEMFELMGYFEEVAEVPQENHGDNGGDSPGDFI